jgi:hypothetical protein
MNNVQWEGGKSSHSPQRAFKLKQCRKVDRTWFYVGYKNGRFKRFCSKRRNIFYRSYFISQMQWKWRRLMSSRFQYRLFYWSCRNNIDWGNSWRTLRVSEKKVRKGILVYPPKRTIEPRRLGSSFTIFTLLYWLKLFCTLYLGMGVFFLKHDSISV